MSKVCVRCDGDGPFNINRAEKDGLSRYCRQCMRKANADFRARNTPEKMRAYDKKSYDKNREKISIRKKKWRNANPEKARAFILNWQRNNPDKLKLIYKNQYPRRNASAKKRYAKDPSKKRESHIKWRNAHPENEKAVRHRRRARKLGARGSSTGIQIKARIEMFGGICAYCKTRMYQSIDHVISLNRGGTNWPANLRPSCSSCNSKKKDRDWKEFILSGEAT